MRRRILVASGAMALLVASCSGADVAEQIIEGQEGVGDVEINEEDGSVKIEVEDEEGDVSAVIGGGEVPEDFPIPVAGGGEVRSVFESEDEANVQLSYPDGQFDSLKEFYEDWAASAGDEAQTTFETSSPPSYGVTVIEGDRSYTVSLSQVGEEVLLNLFVGRA